MKQSKFWCDKCKKEIDMISFTGGYYGAKYQGNVKHLCINCDRELNKLLKSFWKSKEEGE